MVRFQIFLTCLADVFLLQQDHGHLLGFYHGFAQQNAFVQRSAGIERKDPGRIVNAVLKINILDLREHKEVFIELSGLPGVHHRPIRREIRDNSHHFLLEIKGLRTLRRFPDNCGTVMFGSIRHPSCNSSTLFCRKSTKNQLHLG
jgi:hypothetical protein